MFDGYCVLCNWFGRWLRKNYRVPVKLIALQSEQGQKILLKTGSGEAFMDEVMVISKNRVLSGASAILVLLQQTNFAGRIAGRVLSIMPSSWVKRGYGIVARNRYHWFGKRETCSIIQD